ncbi:MAG: NaeI family type II restriction endonuclease, partial [Terriglobales bacterium]
HTLFRRATNRLIPRRVIEQVARQKDALKRAREAKSILEPEGFRVLCAKYQADRAAFLEYGFEAFSKDEWLSIPAAQD